MCVVPPEASAGLWGRAGKALCGNSFQLVGLVPFLAQNKMPMPTGSYLLRRALAKKKQGTFSSVSLVVAQASPDAVTGTVRPMGLQISPSSQRPRTIKAMAQRSHSWQSAPLSRIAMVRQPCFSVGRPAACICWSSSGCRCGEAYTCGSRRGSGVRVSQPAVRACVGRWNGTENCTRLVSTATASSTWYRARVHAGSGHNARASSVVSAAGQTCDGRRGDSNRVPPRL